MRSRRLLPKCSSTLEIHYETLGTGEEDMGDSWTEALDAAAEEERAKQRTLREAT